MFSTSSIDTHTPLSRSFEAGDTDVFNIQAPDVGELKKIRLYHDNKGLGAAWHCEIVIVSCCVCLLTTLEWNEGSHCCP